VVFWDAEAEIGVPASFQISLAASITFTLEIYLSKNENPILKHLASEDGCTTKGSVRTIDLGNEKHRLNLKQTCVGEWGMC